MTNSGAGGSPETTQNTLAGDVTGTSVQAAAIHGGVHFHRVTTRSKPIPRQLKPAPAFFTGRATEFAELEDLTSQERTAPAVVVITGQGGVGKSALALRWLHHAADRFPDGQLYADLAATTEPEPMTSTLARFLRAMGVPGERLPADIAEAAALYRSLTAGRRLALLVENAVSAAQVRTLLPASPSSVVIVATRWRLGGLLLDGARFIPLVPLPPDASTALLTRAVGEARVEQEPAAVAELVALCGGLPIALSIAGARLSMRPRWPVSRIVRELTDEKRRLSALAMERDISVHDVFDSSYRALPAREATAYRWLGVLAGPWFTIDLAAAALGVSMADTEDVLGTLVDASLVDAVDEDRFQFHDLVRLHARTLAEHTDSEADRVAVVERAMRYHVHFAAAADQAVNPFERQLGPVFQSLGDQVAHSTPAAALDALEDELPNLLAALRSGAQSGLDALVWQLCEAMWALFLRRKHFTDWIAAYQLGITAATNTGDSAARSRMHLRLGIAYHNLGRSDEAVAEGEAAVEAARAAAHLGAEAEALQLLGMANRARGRHEEARRALQESIGIAVRSGLPRDEALGRRLLGQTYIATGRLDEAVDQLARAVEVATELSDDHVAANIKVWLADALTRTDRIAEAVVLLEDAWVTLRDSGSNQHKAQLLMVWGWAAERLDDLPTARDLLSRAHDLYAEIGAPHVMRVRSDLDRVEARLGD